MASWNFGHVLAVDDKKITASGMWVEPNFPSMFTVRMLKGNINALSDPSTILINASLAKTFFGDIDPINKLIRLDNKDSYKVAGVFEDFPHNTSLRDSKIFLPWKKYITTEEWLKMQQRNGTIIHGRRLWRLLTTSIWIKKHRR